MKLHGNNDLEKLLDKGAVLGTGTPMVSSKVVQPTATVTSVPVSGPSKDLALSRVEIDILGSNEQKNFFSLSQ